MALFVSDPMTGEFIRAFARRVRFRASDDLNFQDCEDIASRMIFDPYAAAKGDWGLFVGLLNKALHRPRYYKDERKRVKLNRTYQSTTGAGEEWTVHALPIQDSSVFKTTECTEKPLHSLNDRRSKRSLASAGVDVTPMALVEIASLLDLLAPSLRQAFTLMSMGHTMAEIAEMTGTSKATAARHCSRAREALQHLLAAADAA